MILSPNAFAAISRYGPFTANVGRTLANEGLLAPNAAIEEQRACLFETRAAMRSLTRPDETFVQAITRFHHNVTTGLDGKQIPPFLAEAVAAANQTHTFGQFVERFRNYSLHLALVAIAHVEGQELLTPFFQRFAPNMLPLERYEFSEEKKEDFLRDFYLILSATALYDPEATEREFHDELRTSISKLGSDNEDNFFGDEIDVGEDIGLIVQTAYEATQSSERRKGLINSLVSKIEEALIPKYGSYYGAIYFLKIAQASQEAGDREEAMAQIHRAIPLLSQENQGNRYDLHLMIARQSLRCQAKDLATVHLGEAIRIVKTPGLLRKIDLGGMEIVGREIAEIWLEASNPQEALIWARKAVRARARTSSRR
ncbi:MAG TPA: hypothetical protein VFX30_02750 [bacterium]|nr:hypothetical protein [bacterium]